MVPLLLPALPQLSRLHGHDGGGDGGGRDSLAHPVMLLPRVKTTPPPIPCHLLLLLRPGPRTEPILYTLIPAQPNIN